MGYGQVELAERTEPGPVGERRRRTLYLVVAIGVVLVLAIVPALVVHVAATSRLDVIEQRLQKAESAVADHDAKKQAVAAERQMLIEAAGKLIRSTALDIDDTSSGFVFQGGALVRPRRSQARSVTLQNRSRFNVTAIRGTVEYRRADGGLIASMPGEVAGTVLAGQTGAWPLSAGEVTGEAGAPSRFIVQSVQILGGE